MQLRERPSGGLTISHRVGILQLPAYAGLVFLRQVVQHVAFLVNLATLDEGGFPSVTLHGKR